MGKNKRKRKTTVYGVIEGEKTEKNLLRYLKEIYHDPQLTSFTESPIYGGDPNYLVATAIKNSHYDKVFVWIDEDRDLSKETLLSLARCWKIEKPFLDSFLNCFLKNLQATHNTQNRNPILIVSQPVCVESLALRALGHTPPCLEYDIHQRKKQIKQLKNMLDGVIGSNDHVEFYRGKLKKGLLEERRKIIPELDLLISMITMGQEDGVKSEKAVMSVVEDEVCYE